LVKASDERGAGEELGQVDSKDPEGKVGNKGVGIEGGGGV